MRSLGQFSASEWLQLLPVQHLLKQARNDAWQALYVNQRPPELDSFLSQVQHLAGHDVVLVIAFEQPWSLEWLLRRASTLVEGATVLVFDNSRRAEARVAIERVCRERDTPYLALPPNSTRHVNRSHGMAVTWVYRNVVRSIRPRIFGFIDHDLIPLQSVNVAARMGSQPIYGMPLQRKWAWQLWAGYCFFDYAQVGRLPLNFLYDFSNGLDTGGRNWHCLYRNMRRSELRLGLSHILNIQDVERGQMQPMQIVDDCWYHIGGVSYNDNFSSKATFAQRLATELDAGATWAELRERGVGAAGASTLMMTTR